MVINVPQKHKISAIHDFSSQLYLLLYKSSKIPKFVLVKKLLKVGYSRHPRVLNKIFEDLKLYGS